MHFQNDTDLYRVIGANTKYYREHAGLTQVQLAEQAKISISYLSKIEAAGCDKSLSISVLNQIANVLGVEISEFFKSTPGFFAAFMNSSITEPFIASISYLHANA